MKTVYVLSSTHWDREWYAPFEHYRARLVRMIDRLLDILESDPEYKHFHFDGQTILIGDYLRIRPENRERLYKLIKEGRILIGPWHTMPDEFLISGEGLVRNLQRGARECAALGVEANKNGYVCDIFGHNSQMPQIFRGFGIDAVSLFRGRAGYEKDNFLWRGADGTEAIVHKLHPDYAYSSFFFVVRWNNTDKKRTDKEIVERVKAYLKDEEKNFATDCHLMVDGVDHIDPEKDIPHILKVLNDGIPGFTFVHSNLEDYTARIRRNIAALERVEGVLYDLGGEGVNNSVLKNVLSSQVHLKQANDYCESRLTLDAEVLDFYLDSVKEKLNAEHIGMSPYGGYFDEAWDYVLQNQPHDSICGCSVTAVHLDNENRFKRAAEIIELIRADIGEYLSRNIAAVGKGKDGAFAVFNNTQVPIDGTVEVPFEIENGKHQWSFRFYGADGREIPYNILSHEACHKQSHEFGELITFPCFDRFTLAMRLKIEPYSYITVTYDKLMQERSTLDSKWKFDRFDPPNRHIGSMRTAANVIDNGKLTVTVNPNGTLSVRDGETGKLYENLLMFEDCADAGEGWNYVKPAFDEEIVSACQAAQYRVIADCPDYFACKILLDIKTPAKAENGRRSEENASCSIESTIKIFRDSKKLTVATAVDNRAVNHRLRAVFPTDFKTDTFKTLLPFDVYEWSVAKKDWSHTKEVDTSVNPNQGMVSITDGANQFSVYNKGLYEAAVLDRPDRAVYLTLFRSFTNEVGLPANAAKMGRMTDRGIKLEYQLDFGRADNNELVKNANAFKVGLFSVRLNGGKGVGSARALPASDAYLKIDGGAALSSLRANREVGGKIYTTVRVYDAGGGCNGKISFKKKIQEAHEINLAEDKLLGTVKTDGAAFGYTLNRRQIKTFAVRF
ncbi:glycoside hydrolase [Clostridia bacterium]|nr:glycoside hydrolase [Clostridia bacterium]